MGTARGFLRRTSECTERALCYGSPEIRIVPIPFVLQELLQLGKLFGVKIVFKGMALVLDRAVRSARAAARVRNRVQVGWTMAVAGAVIVCSAGIVQRGAGRFHMYGPASKQGVDDRAAVSWLIGERQPGDALISTHLGLPAIWWYGRVSIVGDGVERMRSVYEVDNRREGKGCGLAAVLKDYRRVLVYVGFPDMHVANWVFGHYLRPLTP